MVGIIFFFLTESAGLILKETDLFVFKQGLFFGITKLKKENWNSNIGVILITLFYDFFKNVKLYCGL